MASPLTPDFVPAVEDESTDSYYKIPQVRLVEFATAAGTLATLEGDVSFEAGDAIVTGSNGERWPIGRRDFDEKYVPHGQTCWGETGEYRSHPAIITATQLHSARAVHLQRDRAVLNGRVGDWLVNYAPNDQAIVAHDIFPKLYRRIGVPVDFGISRTAAYAKPEIDALVSELRGRLKHTVFHVRLVDEGQANAKTSKYSLWCLIQHQAPDAHGPIPELLTLSVAALAQARDEKTSLVGHIKDLERRAKRPRLSYVRALLRKLSQAVKPPNHKRRFKDDPELHSVKALAEQLFELDEFNEKLREFYKGKIHPDMDRYMHAFEESERAGDIQSFWEAGAIADGIANRCQRRWQHSVFGLTKDLAERKGLVSLFFGTPLGLVQWGLLGAFMLAGFTELHDGCESLDRFSFLQCDSHIWKAWVGPVSLVMYVIVLILGWWKYIELKSEKIENKHQDYRLLAEYMRVQYVWLVLGIKRDVTETEPPAVPSESGWVVSAVRALKHHAVTPGHSGVATHQACVTWAKDEFLVGQRDYHDQRLIKLREKAFRRIRRCGRIAVVLSIFSFLILCIFKFGEAFNDELRSLDMAAHICVVVLLMSLAVWAAMHKVIDLYAWELEAQRGTLVRSALEKAIVELDSGSEPVRPVFVRCGRFFCVDQAAWHALRRAKPIEVPSGG